MYPLLRLCASLADVDAARSASTGRRHSEGGQCAAWHTHVAAANEHARAIAQARRRQENDEFRRLSAMLPVARAISATHLDKATIVRVTVAFVRLHAHLERWKRRRRAAGALVERAIEANLVTVRQTIGNSRSATSRAIGDIFSSDARRFFAVLRTKWRCFVRLGNHQPTSWPLASEQQLGDHLRRLKADEVRLFTSCRSNCAAVRFGPTYMRTTCNDLRRSSRGLTPPTR